MRTATTNRWERANREAKAAKLAAVLESDPRVAQHPSLTEAGVDFRQLVASLAGVKRPTDGDWANWLTWDRAAEIARSSRVLVTA